MTEREQFIALLGSETLAPADAIILLQGDGLARVGKAAELYAEKMAPIVVISGGVRGGRARGSFPTEQMEQALIAQGVPQSRVMIESVSTNTREQAEQIFDLVKEKKWRHIILVASNYHQYRAWLNFLQVRSERRSACNITSAPVALPWFTTQVWGKRIDLLEDEFRKITLYQRRKHVASFTQGIEYLKYKEARLKSR